MPSVANVTSQKKAKFLSELAKGKTVTGAAGIATVSARQLYRIRKDNEAFAAQWDEAVDSGTEFLEDVARKRAVDGSDTMLIFLLKGRKPATYRDRLAVDFSQATEEQIANALANMSDEKFSAILKRRGLTPDAK